MSHAEPLELQLQRERLARIRIESQLEEAKLQIVEMELTLRQLRDLLAVPGGALAAMNPQSGRVVPVTPDAPEKAEETTEPAPPAPMHANRGGQRKRASSARRAASKVAIADAPDPIDLDADLDDTHGGTATMTQVGPPPIISSLPLHEDDNRETIREFIDHIHTRIEKMQATLAAMNLKELKWHTTWLKDNAAKVGFEVLVEPLSQLEKAIADERETLIGERLDEFIQLTDRITLEPSRR